MDQTISVKEISMKHDLSRRTRKIASRVMTRPLGNGHEGLLVGIKGKLLVELSFGKILIEGTVTNFHASDGAPEK